MRPLYSLLTDLVPEAAVFLSRVVRLLCFGFWDSASARGPWCPQFARRRIQRPKSPECPGQDLSIERWRALQRQPPPPAAAPSWSRDHVVPSRGRSSVETCTLAAENKRTRSVTWKDLIALTGLATGAERRGASLDSVLGRKRPTLQENLSLPTRREGSIDGGGSWKVWS